MNVGSLFSGIGGIELGFEAEGFHTKWFVECEPYATGSAERTSNAGADVANGKSVVEQRSIEQGSGAGQSERQAGDGGACSSADVPNANYATPPRFGEYCGKIYPLSKSKGSSISSCSGWWATEPRLDRVAHGVPNRAHRIRCLGNAVVPQCAQVFAQAIKEVERIK